MREQRVAIGLPGEAQCGFAHRRLGGRIIQDRANRGGDRVGIAVKGESMGYQSKKDWIATQALLLKYGVIKEKKPISTYFTNAYVGN